MTDAPLSPDDERAVQLIVDRIISKGQSTVIRHALEIMRLRTALEQIRKSIVEEANDTVWMSNDPPETIVDFIDATLELPRASRGGDTIAAGERE